MTFLLPRSEWGKQRRSSVARPRCTRFPLSNHLELDGWYSPSACAVWTRTVWPRMMIHPLGLLVPGIRKEPGVRHWDISFLSCTNRLCLLKEEIQFNPAPLLTVPLAQCSGIKHGFQVHRLLIHLELSFSAFPRLPGLNSHLWRKAARIFLETNHERELSNNHSHHKRLSWYVLKRC